jgi:hypothetical protein
LEKINNKFSRWVSNGINKKVMIKEIQNFDKIYGEQIYPADGMIYTIEKANVIKTHSEPELLYYFEVKNGYTKYQIAIFADNKNQHNIAGVYKTGEQGAIFTDKGMSSTHYKNKEFFKTYIVTLINKVIK